MKWKKKTHVEPISNEGSNSNVTNNIIWWCGYATLHRCLGISLCLGDARRASLRAADVNFSGPPKSPLISSNYETRIAVWKIDIWYYHIIYIYILYIIIIFDIDHPKLQWNILKQLHSHLGGETYEIPCANSTTTQPSNNNTFRTQTQRDPSPLRYELQHGMALMMLQLTFGHTGQ